MNQSFFNFLILSLLSASVYSQPSLIWEKSYGGSSLETLYSITETPDSCFIVIGSSFSNDGDVTNNKGGADFWVLKIDQNGIPVWNKNFGGEATDIPRDICCLSDGSLVMVGQTYSMGLDVQGNHGDSDVWVVKTDAFGNLIWQKCFGGTQGEVGHGIKETSDHGFIICGETNSFDGNVTGLIGNTDVWLVKINSNGDMEWNSCLGGNGNEIAYQIQLASDGGYIFFGETNSSNGQVEGHHGNDDCWLAKVNNLGELEWQRALGGSYSDRGWDIHPAKFGGYFLIGYAGSPDGDVVGWHGNYDYWIIRISETGDVLWQRTLGGIKDDFGFSIFGTNDGGCIAGGTTTSIDGDVIDNDGFFDFWIVKLDSIGNITWQTTLGGIDLDFCSSVIGSSDGNFVLAGDSYSNNGDVSSNQGSSDFWIVKLSPETSSTSTPTAIPLNLYPNPASNWITLNLPITEPNMQVSITDELGKQVLSRTIRTDEKLDISTLKAGVYWVSAVSVSGQVYAGKIVKAID
jgi:hypothetical protein